MRFPIWFASIALSALLGLQAWALVEIVALKTDIAFIKGKMSITTEIVEK